MNNYTLYFTWLCSIVDVNEQKLYWTDILWCLHTSEFAVIHPRDANRVEDAKDLRNEFRGIFGPSRGYLREPISVFEVLVALARRGEWEIMHDPDLGDRTSEWFWIMLGNMGLEKYAYRGSLDDPKCDLEVFKIIENFVERGYGRDGKGGPFLDLDQKIDMRHTELWDQMCYYFDRFF